MTVREMEMAAGCNRDTVIDCIKKCYPDLIKHGKKTFLNYEQSKRIMELLPKRNMVMENSLSQPMENSIGKNDEMSELKAMFKELMKMNMTLIQNQTTKQIEYKQDYFGIIGYANKKAIKDLPFSDALKLGKIAGQLSREKGIEIRKIDDERFGQVNSYHIDILKEVFGL